MVLTYFTINDTIIQEAISALIDVTSSHEKLNSPVIVGGIAVQLHNKELDILRPTSDIDLLYLPQIGSYESFTKGIGGELQRILSHKYQIQLKKTKRRPMFEVKLMNGQGNRAQEQFFIHFDQVSSEIAERTIGVSEREVQNAQELEYNNKILLVKRIEDIIPYKLRRARKIINASERISPLERSLYDEAERGNWDGVAQAPLRPWMEYIVQKQNECDLEGKKCHDPEYVLSKDLFDLSLLAQKIESDPKCFNLAYYLMAKKQVDEF